MVCLTFNWYSKLSTLWWTNIAIENGHRNSGFSHSKWWIFPWQNVSSPEGTSIIPIKWSLSLLNGYFIGNINPTFSDKPTSISCSWTWGHSLRLRCHWSFIASLIRDWLDKPPRKNIKKHRWTSWPLKWACPKKGDTQVVVYHGFTHWNWDHEVVMDFRCLLFLNAQMLAVCHYVWLIMSCCFPLFLRIVGCFGSSEHLHWKVMDSAPGQVILSLWHLTPQRHNQAMATPRPPQTEAMTRVATRSEPSPQRFLPRTGSEQTILNQLWYPLVMTNITMERSTIFHGKIHYKWWFSIAMLNYQRVCLEKKRVRIPENHPIPTKRCYSMLLMSLLSLQVCCVHTIPMSLRASIGIHQPLPEETGESAVWAQVTSSQMSLVHPGNWRMAYRIWVKLGIIYIYVYIYI